MNTEPKFKVGDKWKRQNGTIAKIIGTDEDGDLFCSDSWYYNPETGEADGLDGFDLIEKVEPAEHIIEKFKRYVFELENSLQAAELRSVYYQLADLATVARKLYAYEKFIAELKESLKDGDEKRRILLEKIEEL